VDEGEFNCSLGTIFHIRDKPKNKSGAIEIYIEFIPRFTKNRGKGIMT
jgi:hypothetical protein